MKGVVIKEDKARRKRYMEIDIKAVKEDREWISDLVDLLIAKSRRNQKRDPLEQVIAELKQEGRL